MSARVFALVIVWTAVILLSGCRHDLADIPRPGTDRGLDGPIKDLVRDAPADLADAPADRGAEGVPDRGPDAPADAGSVEPCRGALAIATVENSQGGWQWPRILH